MEKLNLRRADNLTTKDLVKTMSKNYEVYNIILEEIIDMNIEYADNNTTLESYDTEEVVYCESDTFDSWLDCHKMAVDMDSYKLYNSYELEELDLDIDYQDLD